MAQRVQWGLYKTRAALPPPPSLNILTATLCVIIAPRMCVCVCRQGPLGRPASWGRCGGQRGLRAPPRACPGPKLCLHLRLIEIIPGSSGFGRWRHRPWWRGPGACRGRHPSHRPYFGGPLHTPLVPLEGLICSHVREGAIRTTMPRAACALYAALSEGVIGRPGIRRARRP